MCSGNSLHLVTTDTPVFHARCRGWALPRQSSTASWRRTGRRGPCRRRPMLSWRGRLGTSSCCSGGGGCATGRSRPGCACATGSGQYWGLCGSSCYLLEGFVLSVSCGVRRVLPIYMHASGCCTWAAHGLPCGHVSYCYKIPQLSMSWKSGSSVLCVGRWHQMH